MERRQGGEKLNAVHLGFSRDGLHWQRVPATGAFIGRGPEGAFDHGQVGAPKNIVEVGDWYYLYYWGTPLGQNTLHNLAGVGLAMVPRDRFVAQSAREDGGYLLTREFVVEGSDLRVNTTVYGQVANARFAAELVHVPQCGGPAVVEAYSFDECDAKADDLIDNTITWRGKGLASLRGTAVQVRFCLRNVGLYAMQCAGAEE